jgi:hypothetical protein
MNNHVKTIIAGLSLLMPAAIGLFLIFAQRWKGEPSFISNLVVHWILFVWLAWYAFPYLGELP